MSKQMTAQQVGDGLVEQGYTPVPTDDGNHIFYAPPEKKPQPTNGWKVLQRNRKWVKGCTITESIREPREGEEHGYRRFTATIRGWEGFRIWEDYVDRPCSEIVAEVIKAVTAIRDRIDKGIETDFYGRNTQAKQGG